jgi:Zn-finger nucleic acid-binding protein
MHCPDCLSSKLTATDPKDGVTAVECPRCHGIWMGSLELSRLDPGSTRVSEILRELYRNSVPGALHCPRCQHTMFRGPFPGSPNEVDSCRTCGGLWFDASEFASVIRLMSREGAGFADRGDPAETAVVVPAAVGFAVPQEGERPLILLLIRIAIICGSSFMLLAALAGLVTWVRQCVASGGLTGDGILLAGVMIVALGMSGLGVWFSLTYRSLSKPELESVSGSGAPSFSDASLICRFAGWQWRTIPCAVIVDPQNQLIHFQNLYAPSGFLTSTHPWHSCPLSQIRKVTQTSYRGSQSLTIVTPTGRAMVPSGASNYSKLAQTLEPFIRKGWT